MRKTILGCMLVLCFAALVAGGCAKKEMVKKEEAVPAVQPTAPPQPVTPKPEVPPEQAKPPITETPAAEAPVQQEVPKEVGAAEVQKELQKIYFDFDSAGLSDQARNTLTQNAGVLSKNPSIKLRIEGNCDERGSDDYNLALGERRAKAAKDYLVNLGVKSDRLSVISYGKEKPVDPGHDEAAWAKNRRDEFVIVK